MGTHIPGMATRGVIPWEFTSPDEQFVQYTWRSDPGVGENGRFVATVTFDGMGWAWRVDSLAPGHAMTLGAGSAPSRDACQELVLECVGKSFDGPAPHRGLATAASRRYTLASGARADLSDLDGQFVEFTLSDGTVRSGHLTIGGHYLVLDSGGHTVKIPSSQVVSIRRRAAHR